MQHNGEYNIHASIPLFRTLTLISEKSALHACMELAPHPALNYCIPHVQYSTSYADIKVNFFFFFFFFKCNRTIGSRSIGHRVWSMSLKLSEN